MPLLTFFDKGGKRRRVSFRYDRRLCQNKKAKKVIAAAWIDDPDASVT